MPLLEWWDRGAEDWESEPLALAAIARTVAGRTQETDPLLWGQTTYYGLRTPPPIPDASQA